MIKRAIVGMVACGFLGFIVVLAMGPSLVSVFGPVADFVFGADCSTTSAISGEDYSICLGMATRVAIATLAVFTVVVGIPAGIVVGRWMQKTK